MDAGRIRVEFIRYALLVTMTVALISVASRADHHDKTTGANGRPGPTATATPTSPAGGSGTPAPSSSASAPGDGQQSDGSTSGSGSGARTAGGATGASGPPATLPRTGAKDASRLTAFAMLLIGWGAWTVVVSRPRAGRSARPTRT